MELVLGPFDPALHVRARDHYEAVRREAQLLALSPDAPPLRFGELMDRLIRQFPPNAVDEVAEKAYAAGEPSFTVRVTMPDELVPAALRATEELEATLAELDEWVSVSGVDLIEAPADVRAHREDYLGQARRQLRAPRGEAGAR